MASKAIQHIYAAIAENPSCGSSTSYTCGAGIDDKDTTSGDDISFQQQLKSKINDDDGNVEVAMRTDREVFSNNGSLPHFGSGSFIPPAVADKESLKERAAEDIVAVNVVVPSSPQKEQSIAMGNKKYNNKHSKEKTPDTRSSSPESSLEYAISSIDGSNNTDEYGSGPHLPSLNEQDVSFSTVGAAAGRLVMKKSIYTTTQGVEGGQQGVALSKDSLSLGSSSMNNSSTDNIELSRCQDDYDYIQHIINNNGDKQQQTVSEFMKTTATPFDELFHDSISSKTSNEEGSDKENTIKTFQRYPSDEALSNNKLSTTNTNTNNNRNTTSPTIAMFTKEELNQITKLQVSTYLTMNERQVIGARVLNSFKECVISSEILDGASSTTSDSKAKEESQCKFLPTLPTTKDNTILQELQASLLNVYNQSIQCQADTTEYIATTTTDAIEEARRMLLKNNSKLECHEADFVSSTVNSEIMLGKLGRSEPSKSEEGTANGSGKKRRENTLASCNGLDFTEVRQCTVHVMELFTSTVSRQVQCEPSSQATKKCDDGQDTVVDSVVETGEKNENNNNKKSGSVSLLDDEQEDIVADNKVIVEDASEGDVEENASSLLVGEGIDDEDDDTYDIEVEMQPDEEQEAKKDDTNQTTKGNKPTSLMKASLNIVRGIGSNTGTKSLTPNTSKAFVTLVTQIEKVEEQMIKTKSMKEKMRCSELLEKLDGAAGVLKEVEENKV